MDKKMHDKGLEVRKAVLGEAYVNNALKNVDDFNRPFQEMLNEYCWGTVWGREEECDLRVLGEALAPWLGPRRPPPGPPPLTDPARLRWYSHWRCVRFARRFGFVQAEPKTAQRRRS